MNADRAPQLKAIVRRFDAVYVDVDETERQIMQLFISYAHESMEKVRETVEILSAGGHAVWFDEQLLPGQDWKRELGEGISRCQAFIYAMTGEALSSEWCQWELATATRLEKAVVPVLLEGRLAVPQGLRQLQYADFTSGATPIAVAKLMGALAIMQKLPKADLPPVPVDPKGIPSRAWESVKHWTDLITPKVYQPQNEEEELIDKFTGTLRRGFMGIKGIEGRMLLTNQRLLFEPNIFSRLSGTFEIPLSAIRTVVLKNTMGVVPYGVVIQCLSGDEYHFVCHARKQIISKIEQLLDHSRRGR